MMNFKKAVSLALCAVLLLPCLTSCKGGGENASESESESISEILSESEEETEKMKECEIIFSRGYWQIDDNGFDGNTRRTALKYISTQRFDKDTLPEGSVINAAEGQTYRLTKWSVYPSEGVCTEISDAQYLIDSEFWDGAEYAAIDFMPNDSDKKKSDFHDVLQISVPGNTKDRREFTWNDDGTLAILAIGNSFSTDALEYVYQVAKSAGVEKVVIGNLFYGACRIYQHAGFFAHDKEVYEYYLNTDGKWTVTKDSSYKAAFGEYDWDYISFQESAQEKQTEEKNYKRLAELTATVKELCPNAKLVYHMPWSNPHANYNMNTETMYNDCNTALRRIIETYGFDEIICTGTAIQNARTSNMDPSLLLRDGWHLSLDIGRYTAALAYFTQLTGISVSDIDFAPKGVSENQKLIAIESAENSRKNPRMVTQSEFAD